jgi:hypothetical protein
VGVCGINVKRDTADMKFKGYVHYASRETSQYLMKSEKMKHVAIHKGAELWLVSSKARKSGTETKGN